MNMPYAASYCNQMNQYSANLNTPKPISFGPQYVYDVNSICRQLGYNLSSAQIITMAQDALLNGNYTPFSSQHT